MSIDDIESQQNETFSEAIENRRVGTSVIIAEVSNALLGDIFVLMNKSSKKKGCNSFRKSDYDCQYQQLVEIVAVLSDPIGRSFQLHF